jgi:hypothetical protein
MVYRLSMPLDSNACFEIEHNSLEGLLEEYEKLGGDRDWILNSARASVAASQQGESVRTLARSMGAEVISDNQAQEPTNAIVASDASSGPVSSDPFASPASGVPVTKPETPKPSTAGTTRTALRSEETQKPLKPVIADPWAEDAEPAPQAAQVEKNADPWPGEAAVVRAALTSNKTPAIDPWGAQEPGTVTSAPPPVNPAPIKTLTDTFGREFTIGLDNMPLCSHGKPAAKMTALSKQKKKYTAFVCAKKADDFRNACKFQEYPD